MHSLHHLLSSLLDLYRLMNSSDHIVGFFMAVLEEFCHRKGKMRRDWKGEVPKDLFVDTLSAHRENYSFESHAFLLSSSNILIIFIRLVLEDSSNPFPWG
jgi:hypothetical protein